MSAALPEATRIGRQTCVYFSNPLVHDFYVTSKAGGIDGLHKSRKVIACGCQVSLGTMDDWTKAEKEPWPPGLLVNDALDELLAVHWNSAV